jgi:uncharacterized membrane protein
MRFMSAYPELDEPARSDGFVRGLSAAIGGPLGDHAVRPPRSAGGSRFWTPVRVVLAMICVVLALNWVQKSPCRDGAWENLNQYKHFCYTDVLALYYAEDLGNGAVPYAGHDVEYPVLTGALMGAIGLPVHAWGSSHPAFNQGQSFYDLTAIALGALGIATAVALLALRRRRPWDAALFALAPAMLVTATVNWDLLAVALCTATLWAWARHRPGLAGIFLALGVSAKLYPLFLLGAILVLTLRTGRWRALLVTACTAVITWTAVNLPVAVLFFKGWSTFYAFNQERGIDWGTIWYIGQHAPLGRGRYGLGFFQRLGDQPGHSLLNLLWTSLFIAACVGVFALAMLAPRRPRLAQLAFLIVAAFLVVGKVWSQQYVLWLIPLAVLARPRWGAFLAWQAAELAYFFAFYGELMGASGRNVFPEGVFVAASGLRLVTLCVLIGLVVRDVMRPERDVVRHSYDDDPDGGEFDGAPDAGWLQRVLRRRPNDRRVDHEPASVAAGAGLG